MIFHAFLIYLFDVLGDTEVLPTVQRTCFLWIKVVKNRNCHLWQRYCGQCPIHK